MGNSIAVTPEMKFCVRYLRNHGVDCGKFQTISNILKPDDPDFELVKVPESKKTFFVELAEKLRELWPPGDKDGKWAWRDSVPNLSRRLELLWSIRFPDKKEEDFSIDHCLAVARKYISQYENDVRYMQTLKYFILKQDDIVKANGHITHVNKSKFADMLEGDMDFAKMDEEWRSILEDASVGEGELI